MYQIVFDFDGVIADTFTPFAEFLADNRRISLEKSKQKIHSHSLNNNRPSIVKTFIKRFYIKKFAQFLETKEDLINHDLLDKIEKLDSQKYIVTRNNTLIPEQLLNQKKSIFTKIYGYNNSKNKIRAIQKIIKESSGSSLNKIVFVTDTVGDVREVSKILNQNQIIAVSWGFNSRHLLSQYIDLSQIVDEPGELILKINEITSS